MEILQLDRFQLTGLLGSGADYEVRCALDSATGGEVVVKRPVPQVISRNLHGSVEQRTDQTIKFHQALADSVPAVVPMVGYTERANHNSFFGDALEQEYRVTVSQRARGIPLVGDPRARILRVPIGLGQNLFCLFPPPFAGGDDPFPVQRQLLDAQERFFDAGYILLDMGPPNIFFSPGTLKVSIIDPGALLELGSGQDRTPVGRGPQDIHDFYLELLKFYTTFQPPPVDVAGYRDPYNLRPVVNFDQELQEMSRSLAAEPSLNQECKDLGAAIIEGVRGRAYPSIADFRRDYTDFLEAIRQRNLALADKDAALQAWRQAAALLREDHWSKYLFDVETELNSLAAS